MGRALALLPLAHCVLLIVSLVAGRLVVPEVPAWAPERAWWQAYSLLSLLNEFTPFFFLPLPLWLVTLAVARSRRALLATALPWALFLWLYGGLFVPRLADVAAAAGRPVPTGRAVRLMTFNLLGITRAAGDLAATIRRADPDVLVVQELSPGLATALDDALAATYPFRRLRASSCPELGAGTWSRYSIQSEELWDGSRRGARWQHLELALDGQAVHVVNLHLTTPVVRWRGLPDLPLPVATGEVTQGRSVEVTWLAPRLRALAGGLAPTIVAGDLNLTDQTPEYRRLLGAGFADAHRRAGWGFGHTFPALPTLQVGARRIPVPVPLVRIDYVLYSSRVDVRQVATLPAAGGSDHRPVVVDLVLLRSGR